MNNKIWIFPFLLFLCVILVSCKESNKSQIPDGAVDATEYGVSVNNEGKENSKNLQKLIDGLSSEGGTIYIPVGEYEFSENGTQTIGSHCIKMRSNVSIIGDGEGTVLKPMGKSEYGLDMFYFNDYLDIGEAIYLENCRFESFTIDAAATSLNVYTSAGKGFMLNLFRNCHWKNITVKNTDATGFGVDCPINSSITDCKAIDCGKAAVVGSEGASGFGIGFGYTDCEDIIISRCYSSGNKKFGFFFEHQGRFDPQKYSASEIHDFKVLDSFASNNLYNFGGISAASVSYTNCKSERARQYGFYFENSVVSKAVNCESLSDLDSSFAIRGSGSVESYGVYFEACVSTDTCFGVKIIGEGAEVIKDALIRSCIFTKIKSYTVYAQGGVQCLTLVGNKTDRNNNLISDTVTLLKDKDNSWN